MAPEPSNSKAQFPSILGYMPIVNGGPHSTLLLILLDAQVECEGLSDLEKIQFFLMGSYKVQLTDQAHIWNSKPKKYHPRGSLKPLLRLMGPGRDPRGLPWALPLRD